MGYHLRLRGQLTFADAATAERAFTSFEGFLLDVASLDGKRIRAEHDGMVSYSTDVSGALSRLQAAAHSAVSGKIAVRSEGETSDTFILPPPQVYGKKAGYTAPFALIGSLELTRTADPAFAALTRLVGSTKGLTLTGSTITMKLSGRAAEPTIFATQRWLWDHLPLARAGDVRLKYLVATRDHHAPVTPFGPQQGAVAYVWIDGGLRFRNAEERAKISLEGLPFTGVPRGARQISVHGEHMMTKASYDSALKATQKLLTLAGGGEISLYSSWGARNLGAKKRR